MNYQVLLVSDDMAWQTTSRRALEAAGHAVASARDSDDALRAIMAGLPGLVVHEPRGDEKALQLARHVRALPGGSTVPFIAVASEEERISFPLDAGYTTLLAKSATSAVLKATVEALLERRQRDPVGRGRPIVLVDDNAIQRKLLRLVLGQWGFRVEEAGSAREALELARRVPPAAIVSDFLMPGGDGLQLCSLAKRDRLLARVPFIVVSSILLTDQEVEAAHDFGADAFVSAGHQHRGLARALVALLGTA